MLAQLREKLQSEVGEEKNRSWEELGDEQQYQALLSYYFWGASAVVVNEFVQEYLSSLWDARHLVICGQTASNGTGLHGREATSSAGHEHGQMHVYPDTYYVPDMIYMLYHSITTA
jgi:hypothetical protein